eukprot:7438881-Alexandrium_andersonii.AAC.1
MSASLVGSEMCIRDSSALRTAHWTQCTAHSAQHTAQRTQHTAQRTPVSYTHLTLPTICSV